MSDIRVLIVVDGIFSLTTTYPIDPTVPPFGPESDPTFGPDAWFTLSHLINTLRNSPSPTFTVDTASRGFNAAGNFPNSCNHEYGARSGRHHSRTISFRRSQRQPVRLRRDLAVR